MSVHDYVTTLSPEMLQRARDELGENDELIAQSLQILRAWLKQNPHLKACPTDAIFLLKYLRGCKYSLEKVKKKLDMQLTLRGLLPEFFSGWDPMHPQIQKALGYGGTLPLPGYDHLGRKVLVIRAGCHDTLSMSYEYLQRASMMISELCAFEDEQMFITGMVIIFDMNGYTMSHFTQVPIAMSKKLMPCFDEANPLRPKSMNMVHTSTVFNLVMNLMNSLMKEKMRSRIKVHGDDLESLHKEICKEVLPKEYGGDGMTFQELTVYWKKKAEENREYFLKSEAMKSNEALRPGRPKTSEEMFGIEGSFRKLNID